MAIIKSGASSDQLTIGATSKAARVTPFNSSGVESPTNNPTFTAAVVPTASTAGTAGVICNIIGSATKTVRVYRISILATIATTAAECRFNLFKRTTAVASAGTSAAMTPVALDSADTATATANFFSAVGTIGTGGGILETRGALLGLVASATVPPAQVDFYCPQYGTSEAKPWVLRGVLQSLEVTQVTAPANTPTFAVAIYFSEDAS